VDKYSYTILNFQDSKNNSIPVYHNIKLTQSATKELIKLNIFGESKKDLEEKSKKDSEESKNGFFTSGKRFYNFIRHIVN
jgi:hypothetical protein